MPDPLRILYVEDDLDIQTIARLALVSIGGYEVTVCSTGEEGIVEATRHPPDLILVDVMMPGMDGPTTLAAMRRIDTLKDIPVAFITAKVQPAEVEYYTSLGALAVIAKPFDPMTLSARVQAIWDSRPTP